jgi:small subunit ribosomal protein S20
MPNTKSAAKRDRQNERRRSVNTANRSKLRTQMKKLRAAIAALDAQAAQTLLPATVALLDKSIQQGVLHRNAAARHKSRLTLKVNSLAAK